MNMMRRMPMSQRKAKYTIFFLLIFIAAGTILINSPVEYKEIDLPILQLKSAQNHTPIMIDGNSALDIFPNKTGSGNAGDPYVIEDLEINMDGSGSGIVIKNTDRYLIIRNCTIENSGTLVNETDAGIKLDNTGNILISDNHLANILFGIYLRSSLNNTIFANTIFNSSADGIRLQNSFDIDITYNNISNCSGSGIFLLFSDENSVSYNNITGNQYGIRVGQSGNNEIFMNSVSYSDTECIFVESGADNDIHDNDLDCNGYVEPEPDPPDPPYPDPPIFMIGIIGTVIGATIVVGRIVLNRKKRKLIPEKHEIITQPVVSIDNVKKIKDLFTVSKSVRIEAVAEVLGMDRAELLQFIVESRKKLPGIVIDGDFIKTDSVDDVSDFVDILDRQFESWKGTEKSKDGKT